MVVDKTRRNRKALGIDRFRRAPLKPANLNNPTVSDSDISYKRRQPGTIDDTTTTDQQVIIHVCSSSTRKWGC
jgi:hypothetical protein